MTIDGRRSQQGSGSGKTTLLNTFLQRNLSGLHVAGRVEVNGNVIGPHIAALSGYAQQEEMFVGTLTVREYLCVQARLRTPFSRARREKRVDVVLSSLGLSKCQNNKIGIPGVLKGISGGEARRLTFACELLSNPALLFCDEPTTGLDSFLAEHIVELLSSLAKSGRTVVCTIHQPASQLYLMFDRVMFIANSRTAFFGAPHQSISFFEECGHPCPENFNPADMIIHALAIVPHEEDACRVRITAICDAFAKGNYGSALNDDLEKLVCSDLPPARRQVSILCQICALFHRYFLDTLRKPSLTRAKLLQKFIMALFIGLLYFQVLLPPTVLAIHNLNGALFIIVCELTYSTLFTIVACLPSDFPLLVREFHDGIYQIFSYYVARILSYFPLFTIDGLFLLYICYWMIGLSTSAIQVFTATVVCFIVEQSASAFGLMLGSITPSYPVASSIAGPIVTILSLTGGLYANVGSLPLYIRWVQYISWFRFGFESLMINQWNEVDNFNTTWTEQDRDEILARFAFNADRLWINQVIMVAYIFFYYLVGYIGLSIRVYRAR